MFDVKIRTANAANMISKLYVWRQLVAERLPISKIDRRILIALSSSIREFILYMQLQPCVENICVQKTAETV